MSKWLSYFNCLAIRPQHYITPCSVQEKSRFFRPWNIKKKNLSIHILMVHAKKTLYFILWQIITKMENIVFLLSNFNIKVEPSLSERCRNSKVVMEMYYIPLYKCGCPETDSNQTIQLKNYISVEEMEVNEKRGSSTHWKGKIKEFAWKDQWLCTDSIPCRKRLNVSSKDKSTSSFT